MINNVYFSRYCDYSGVLVINTNTTSYQIYYQHDGRHYLIIDTNNDTEGCNPNPNQ